MYIIHVCICNICMYVCMYMYMYLWLSRRIHYAISSCLVQEVEVIKCNISTIFRTSLSYNRSNKYRATVHSTGITSVKCIETCYTTYHLIATGVQYGIDHSEAWQHW